MGGAHGAGEGRLHPNWVAEAHALDARGRPLASVRADAGASRAVAVAPDPMSAAVITLQGMVQDGLGGRTRPVSAVFGERVLALVPGRWVHVGAVLRGRPDRGLRASMQEAGRALDAAWGPALSRWSGAVAELAGLAEGLRPVVERTSSWGPGEVDDPLQARGVFAVTASDFEGGRVRLKVAVFSAALAPVQDAYVELSYGRDLLRLDGSRPERALDEAGRLNVGIVSPGETASVAALLEPLVPGGAVVEGELSWFGEGGAAPRHVELPRRVVQVASPEAPAAGGALRADVAARGSADTASREWRYPPGLGAKDVLRTARTILGTRGLELGAGSEEGGPPPSWTVEAGATYGAVPLAVGLTVVGGDERRLRLSAVSTDASVVAWAVSELRQQLQEAFFRRWRGIVELEEVRPGAQLARTATDTEIYDRVPL